MATTTDPAVLSWMIALAPRPKPEPSGRHWWRELVTDAWRSANEAWERQLEATTSMYEAEVAEYAAEHPRPRLGDFMRHLSHGRYAPETLELDR